MRPSGEMATRAPPAFCTGWSASVGRSATPNCVSGWAGGGRSQPHSAAAVATAATPASASVAVLHRDLAPLAARAGAAAASSATVLAYDLSLSASANSAALANRSAGSFSSAVRTAASTCRGIVCRWVPSGRGDSVRTRATTAWAVLPVKGGSPVSIS